MAMGLSQMSNNYTSLFFSIWKIMSDAFIRLCSYILISMLQYFGIKIYKVKMQDSNIGSKEYATLQ